MTTGLRWLARVLGLIVVAAFSLMVLVASQAGTGGVWWTMVILVGGAVLGYLIACVGAGLTGEAVGGATMIAVGFVGGIFVATQPSEEGLGLADVLFSRALVREP